MRPRGAGIRIASQNLRHRISSGLYDKFFITMQDRELTGVQIRSARGALGWSVQDLAERSGVGTATIVRYESAAGVPRSRKNNLNVIRNTFEAAGIEFIGTPEDGPGIRIYDRGSHT